MLYSFSILCFSIQISYLKIQKKRYMKTYKFLQYIPFVFAFLLLGGEVKSQCISMALVADSVATATSLGAGGSKDVCPGTTYMLFHSAASGSVGWDLGSLSNIVVHNVASPTDNYTAVDTLYVTFTGTGTAPIPIQCVAGGGVTHTYTFDATSLVKPTALVDTAGGVANGHIAACYGDSLSVIAYCVGCSNVPLYEWLDAPVSSPRSYKMTSNESVTLAIYDGNTPAEEDFLGEYCSDTIDATLLVRANPVITSINDTICVDEVASIVAEECGTAHCTGGTLQFTWYSGGTLRATETGAGPHTKTSTDLSISTSSGGNNDVQIILRKDSAGVSSGVYCRDTVDAFFLVNQKPNVEAVADDSTICLGTALTLSTPASSLAPSLCAGCQSPNPVASYTWDRGGVVIGTPGTNSYAYTPSVTGNPVNYNVTVTGNNGCTATDPNGVDVKVYAIPNIGFSVSPSATICSSDTALITATCSNCVDEEYSWSPLTGNHQGNEYYTGPLAATAAYTVTVYDTIVPTAGDTLVCTDSDVQNITVLALPTVTLDTTFLSTSGNACGGDTIIFTETGSPSLAHTWSIVGTGTVSETNDGIQTDTFAQVLTSTSIIAVEVDNGSCVDQDTITVTLLGVPAITLTQSSTVICEGEAFDLDATLVGGTNPFTITWEKDSAGVVTTYNGSSLADSTVLPFSNSYDGTTTYTIIVEDTVGCIVSQEREVRIYDCGTNELINRGGGAICRGEDIDVYVNDPAPAGNFIWTYYYGTPYEIELSKSTDPDKIISVGHLGLDTIITKVIVCIDDTSSTPTIDPVTKDTFYPINCSPKATVYDTTVIAAIDLVLTPSDTTVCYGDSIYFEATCPSCVIPISYYLWNSDSTAFLISPSETTRDELILQDSIYRLVVENERGCLDTFNRSIGFKPIPGVNCAPGDTAYYCPTSSVALTANTTEDCTYCSYLWSTGQISETITINEEKDYIVTVSLNGCTDQDTVLGLKHPIPKPIIIDSDGNIIATTTTAQRSLFLCGGDPDTLFVDTSSCINCSYIWNNSSTSPFLEVASQGGYFVQAQDSNGCFGYSDPVLAVNSMDGIGAIASANPSRICGAKPAILEVTPCLNCRYEWHNVDSVAGVVLSTSRLFSVADAGSYYASIVNEDSCEFVSNIVTVDTVVLLPPNISFTSDTICAGQTTTLSTNNDPSYTYLWYDPNGDPITGATNYNYTTSTAGDYYVEVTYPSGCTEASPIVTIVTQLFTETLLTTSTGAVSTPVPSTTPEICNGSSINISAVYDPAWSYQWYRNGVAISGVGANGATYSADTAGIYYAEVTTDLLCVERTDSMLINTSSLGKPTASTNSATICPGDTAQLNVSLCVSCEYRWYNGNTGANLVGQDSFDANFYNANVTNTGIYFAAVQKGVCIENSDTISVTLENVPFPTLVTNKSIVCNGVDATLSTAGCSNCDYTWMKDSIEIIGALNDTFYLVNNPLKAGNYSVRVDYPTGCADTSNVITVADGSYSAFIRVDTLPGNAPDSIICNTVGEDLVAYTTPSGKVATITTFSWIKDGVPFYTSATATYNGANVAGEYKVEMTDNDGCIQESNILPLREINFVPNITTNVTEICGPGGAAMLSITNPCSGCSYNWIQNGTPIAGATQTTYITQPGSAGAGLYSISVIQEGCQASSNVQSIVYDPASATSSLINASDTSICAGDSVSVFRQDGNGSGGFTFQWLWSATSGVPGSPVPLATTYTHSTNLAGYYTLELTKIDLLGNPLCVDTSAELRLYEVQAPVGFNLDLTTVSPLPASGGPVNLDQGLSPGYLGNTGFTNYAAGEYSSTPFNGALSPNAGLNLSAPNYREFVPADSLSGYHLIIYSYDTLGCIFQASDILQVLDPAEITITNLNPNAVSYEACVGDTLAITISNFTFDIDSVFLFDQQDVYDSVTIINTSIQDSIYPSGDTVYNGTVLIVVPEWSKASYLMITTITGGPDTAITPFVLIHNEDLSFSGLPVELCSNGSPVVLEGVPAGGTFRVQYLDNALATTYGNSIINGDTLYPTEIDSSNYLSEMQDVQIWYNYLSTYTNGKPCPSTDTTSLVRTARAVHLNSITYFPIATSQTKEELVDLVNVVMPYKSNPNVRPGDFSFSGSFTNPVGDPVYFLPATATAGQQYELTYTIENGTCSNSVADSILVINPPLENNLGISLPDTMCRIHGDVTLQRYANSYYNYLAFPTFTGDPLLMYADTANIFQISSTNTNQGLTLVNGAVGSETYTYNPGNVTGNYDTLVIEYLFRRTTDSLLSGTKVDTQEYIRGSIIIPIYIEDTFSVNIVDTVVQSVYCEADEIHLLAADTIGGYFMLYGGTGQYQDPSGDTLTYGYINPYEIHQNESTDVSYNLVYIWEGLVCRNIDSMRVTIPEPPVPDFTFGAVDSIYCKTDTADLIFNTITLPDTGKWYIDEILQTSFTFDPSVLSVGSHIVKHSVFDTFGCITSAIDTFEVRALPVLSMTPQLATEYCNNDTTTEFIVSPSPTCQQFATGSASVATEVFDVFTPVNWTVEHVNTGGSNWLQAPTGGLAGGSGATVPSSNQLENTWLITEPYNLDQGKVYQITYWVKTACPTGSCSPAAMRLKIGQGANSAALISTLADYPSLANTNYTQYSVTYNCPATAAYNIGFQCYSGNTQSSDLFIDQFEIKDISAQGCLVGGVGTISGTGASQIVDSAFIFDPTIASPGNVHFVYSYTDSYGCGDSLVQDIEIKAVPAVSFTNLDSAYCANAPVDIVVPSPLLGGTFVSSLSNLKGQIVNTIGSVTYDPNNDGTDYISYTYTDPSTQCTNVAYDTVIIAPMVDSAVIDAVNATAPGYCEDAAGIVLNALPYNNTAPNPGIFYGNGVRNGAAGPGAASFYPDSAVIDGGRTGDMVLTYIYTTTTGCVDTTRFTTRVHKLPNLNFINLPDSICFNDTVRQIYVNHKSITGTLGSIITNDTLPLNVVGGFTTPTINTFLSPTDNLLHPNGAGYGYKQVKYIYTDVRLCKDTIVDSVRVDTVPNVYFAGLQPATPPHFYCENDPASVIYAFPPYKVGSGYLQVGNQVIDSSFYEVVPSAMATPPTTADYQLYYTYTDDHGCTDYARDSFEVRAYPRITMTIPSAYCDDDSLVNLMSFVIPTGGVFSDNLAPTAIKQDSLLALNAKVGERTIYYDYTDPTTTCKNGDENIVNVYHNTVFDFAMIGGCVGATISFEPDIQNLLSGVDSLTSVIWEFDTTVAPTAVLPPSPTSVSNATHVYGTDGIYPITLTLVNQGICSTQVSKPLVIAPYIADVHMTPYSADFQSDEEGWYGKPVTSASRPNAWWHGGLWGNIITDPGNKAWVTFGQDTSSTNSSRPYTYLPGDEGTVYSPCFDLVDSRRPMFVFDIWRDMTLGIDGAILEYYDVFSDTWQRIGEKGKGIEWYNSDFLLARPGNQQNLTYPQGWTGESWGWENARFRLDNLKGRDNVRFRLSFSSDPQTVLNGKEGMAFDNVWIGERTRNVLLEHFSNPAYVSSYTTAKMDYIDKYVYGEVFNTTNGLDVNILQYQSGLKDASDALYNDYTAGPDARGNYYGISEEGELLVDGLTVNGGRSEDISANDLDYEMLQFPKFDIDINQMQISNGNVDITSVITANEIMPNANYRIHTVIVEDSIVASSPSVYAKKNIVRSMLPNPAGEAYVRSWLVGDQETVTHSWPIASFVQNAAQLHAVVFVQEEGSQKIYQAQTTQNLTIYHSVSVKDVEEGDPVDVISNVKVYPNPTTDYLNVEFSQALEGEHDWQMIDVLGRTLISGTTNDGDQLFTINTERLSEGAYFFVIRNDKVYTQRKVIISKN